MFELDRYEVTGVQPVLGHQPGSFFEDDLEPALEQRLIARGSIRKVSAPAATLAPLRLDDLQPDLPPPGGGAPHPTTAGGIDGDQ